MSDRIRVLVVDDSALMRKLIPRVLESDASLEVVGTAMDGEFALRKIEELRPHVVTLDLEMPRMGGIELLRLIHRQQPLPVIVFSTHSHQGASATFKALALGAIDFVAKPADAAAGHLETIKGDLIEKIKIAARIGRRQAPALVSAEPPPVEKTRTKKILPPNRIIAIGVSTGGPNALQYVLPQMPADFPACVLVVQHMPEGFTEMFARRLHDCCALDVSEARSGDLLVAGRVLICPGNRHLLARRMPRGDMAVLSDGPPVNGHRPSVDVLFHSVALAFGPSAVGLLMTGMGEDGAEGLGAIQRGCGMTIAQSEETCVVSGMPHAAIAKGYATSVVALDGLGAHLVSLCAGDDKAGEPSDRNEKVDKNAKSERTPVSSSGA